MQTASQKVSLTNPVKDEYKVMFDNPFGFKQHEDMTCFVDQNGVPDNIYILYRGGQKLSDIYFGKVSDCIKYIKFITNNFTYNIDKKFTVYSYLRKLPICEFKISNGKLVEVEIEPIYKV